MGVLIISITFAQVVYIIRIIQRDAIINVNNSSRQVPVILVIF